MAKEKPKEYIVYEVVEAMNIDQAEEVAQSNDINPQIELLQDFIDDNIDYDALREQVLEEEGQNQEDNRNDLD